MSPLYRTGVSNEHPPESERPIPPAHEGSGIEQGISKAEKTAPAGEQKPPASAASPPKKRKDWSRPRSPADEEARRIIRSEMERRDMSYAQLAALLEPRAKKLRVGRITEHNLASRINRGTFTFGFAIEVLRAIGTAKIDIVPLAKSSNATR